MMKKRFEAEQEEEEEKRRRKIMMIYFDKQILSFPRICQRNYAPA